ncbi:unnamed protein product [Euphydryas editha]|uniref:G-protein coupled receptors family 1 profile domain-containing protein n=1 Tax=Euphydryas editha TaxID=104508 RepID=A0AAU9UFQ7_EUPED|nr:unnamed protein product [Euphydryas editha]
MAFKLTVTAFTTLLVCNLCLSAYSEVNNTNILNDLDSTINNKYIKYASHDKIANTKLKDTTKCNYLRYKRSLNASIDVANDIKDENITYTINKEESKLDLNDKDKMVANRTTSDEDVTTEYFDTSNFTEEPCIGDPEFCNMTKEEYLSMLNDYIYPHPHEWVLIATHAIVFIIGLIGNALVCIAVYRNHSMRTVTNYFIVNLAVADFMVILICLPPTVLWDVTETWFFGTAMCRIVLYFQVSCIYNYFVFTKSP